MNKLMICLLGLPFALGGCMTTEQRAELKAQVAAADDSECRSYGADKGTPAYVECRLVKDQQHAQAEAAAERENEREFSCSTRLMASGFGTAQQQHDKKMALAESGC
jgi:hypothetical protein